MIKLFWYTKTTSHLKRLYQVMCTQMLIHCLLECYGHIKDKMKIAEGSQYIDSQQWKL